MKLKIVWFALLMRSGRRFRLKTSFTRFNVTMNSPRNSSTIRYEKYFYVLAMSVIVTLTAGNAWSEQVQSRTHMKNGGDHFSIKKCGLTGHYKGSVKKILDSLGFVVPLTYTASPRVSVKVISGTLEQASLPDALREMLVDFNFMLNHDVESGAVHVHFLDHQPDHPQVKGFLSSVTKFAPQEYAPDQEDILPVHPGDSLDELSQELQEQFDVANQETLLSPALQEQFEVAHQETVLSPELQEQFDVANQETVLSPELQEQFDVANQETMLSPALQEQFDVANQETVLSPELQEQFDVANQETMLSPALQEQFDVAHGIK